MPAALMEAVVEAERASSGQRALLAWPPHPFVMLVHPRMRWAHDPQRWLVLTMAHKGNHGWPGKGCGSLLREPILGPFGPDAG
jgi:hypothetical protein